MYYNYIFSFYAFLLSVYNYIPLFLRECDTVAKRITAIIAAAVLVLSLVMAASADFGDYGGSYDFGGGGSFDYGGSSFDFGDSYDYDSYDYGGSYDDSYDDSYDYGNYGGGYVSAPVVTASSALSGIFSVFKYLFIAAVIVIIIIIIKKSKSKGSSGRKIMPGAVATNPASLRRVSEYTALDPAFSDTAFTEKLSNMYVRFQNAWQEKDMEPLRPYLTDALYAQCNTQLDAYRRNRQTNRVERIAVLGADIVGWKQEGGNDVMVARLRTRIVDYVVDDATGNIVRGSNTAEKFMEYEWTLVRSSGQVTTADSGTKAQNCPNCGAAIDINRTAVCEYCGSVLTTDTFDWAVSEIKALSQRTAQ